MLKHDEHSHGVPGGSRIDDNIFEFNYKVFQTIQPPMLLFIHCTMPVHSALLFFLYISNSKLGWVEFWLEGQCQHHAPPQNNS